MPANSNPVRAGLGLCPDRMLVVSFFFCCLFRSPFISFFFFVCNNGIFSWYCLVRKLSGMVYTTAPKLVGTVLLRAGTAVHFLFPSMEMMFGLFRDDFWEERREPTQNTWKIVSSSREPSYRHFHVIFVRSLLCACSQPHPAKTTSSLDCDGKRSGSVPFYSTFVNVTIFNHETAGRRSDGWPVTRT